MKLQALSIEAKNVLGARHVVIQPGRVTTIKGRNGAGKSSALAAVSAALGGGNLANLARIEDGVAQEPEIVVLLGEPGQPERLRVTKTAKGTRVKERVDNTAAFRDVKSPQTFLEAMFDGRAANPVAFLTASERDLVQMVLEAIPLELDRERFEAIVGDDAGAIAGRESLRRLHPLEEIAATSEALFNARTGINRDAKNADAAVDRLRRATPALIEGTEARAELEAVAAGAKDLREVLTTDRARIDADLSAAVKAAEIAAQTAKETARAAYSAALDAADHAFQTAKAEANAAAADERAALADEQRELDRLEAKARELQTAIEQAVRDQTLADQADREERAGVAFRAHADRLTAKLGDLEALGRSMARRLPIRGLEIRDRGIWLDGVPFGQANTARRVEMAVDLALVRSAGTTLPIVVVDGMEALDGATFAALAERLAETEAQVFVARVADEPISVTSDGVLAGRVDLGQGAA